MSGTYEEKEKQVLALFEGLDAIDDRYQKIIDLGKSQHKLLEAQKIDDNLVRGCQSRMYLVSEYVGGFVFFKAESDALISSGLASLLLAVYSGELPETILKKPPEYIEKLGIRESLTPGRANGLASLYLRMKQHALAYYMQKNS